MITSDLAVWRLSLHYTLRGPLGRSCCQLGNAYSLRMIQAARTLCQSTPHEDSLSEAFEAESPRYTLAARKADQNVPTAEVIRMRFIRVWTLSLVVLVFSTQVTQAQTPASAGTADSVTAKVSPFTDQLRRTVVFIKAGFVKGSSTVEITGTGFLVVYPDPRLSANQGFLYLVTNRHMAEPGAEEGQKYSVTYSVCFLNVNPTPQNVDTSHAEALSLLSPGRPWYFPSDPAVDLAIIPVSFQNASAAQYLPIPVSSIATKKIIEDQGIAAGDQVLFAGYFYQYPGSKKIQPIVREGILAMMPDEKLSTTLQKPGEVYLADIHAFHGNSGSPLFVNTGGLRGGGVSPSRYMLLGVVSGYYPEDESSFSLPAARVLTGEVHDNSGVTVIVPGDQLMALLDSPALKEARESAIQELPKKNN